MDQASTHGSCLLGRTLSGLCHHLAGDLIRWVCRLHAESQARASYVRNTSLKWTGFTMQYRKNPNLTHFSCSSNIYSIKIEACQKRVFPSFTAYLFQSESVPYSSQRWIRWQRFRNELEKQEEALFTLPVPCKNAQSTQNNPSLQTLREEDALTASIVKSAFHPLKTPYVPQFGRRGRALGATKLL